MQLSTDTSAGALLVISPAGGVDSLSASAPTIVVPGVVGVTVAVLLAAEVGLVDGRPVLGISDGPTVGSLVLGPAVGLSVSASPPPQAQQPTRASTPFVSTWSSIIPQSESQPTPHSPDNVQYKAVSYSRHPSPSWFSQPGVSAQVTTTEGAVAPPPHTQHASVDWTPDSEG